MALSRASDAAGTHQVNHAARCEEEAVGQLGGRLRHLTELRLKPCLRRGVHIAALDVGCVELSHEVIASLQRSLCKVVHDAQQERPVALRLCKLAPCGGWLGGSELLQGIKVAAAARGRFLHEHSSAVTASSL